MIFTHFRGEEIAVNHARGEINELFDLRSTRPVERIFERPQAVVKRAEGILV